MGGGPFLGPGQFNLDASISKLIHFTEKQTLQFRSEFFNILNHANLNNPTANVSNGNFGRILGAGNPRVIQLALKYMF